MEQNNLRNSVLGGFFWKFCERFLSQGITFVTSVILARMLVPEDYGIIALITVFTNLATVFINSGFSTALIQKKDADDRDFSTMFFCSLTCSVFIYFILFLAAPLVADFYENPELTVIFRVFSLQIPLGVYQSIQNAYISRYMLFRKVFISSIFNAVISGAAGVGFAFAGLGVWSLVIQYLVGTVTNSIVLTFLIPWRPQMQFSKDSAKSMMRYGSRILAADFSATFFAEIRSLIVGKVYSSADLAFYNKGLQIPQLITNNLQSVLLSVMFPAFANFSDDLTQVKMMAKRSLQMLAYVLVPCMFGLAAIMEPLVLLLFTDKWAGMIPYGQILSIDLCISVLAELMIQVLKAIGRSDVVLGLEVKKKPIYFLLLLVGVSISVKGLAIAMVVYDVFSIILNMSQLKKCIGYRVKEQVRDLLPTFLLGVIIAVAVCVIPNYGGLISTIVVKILAGVFLYVLGSVLFKMNSFVYLKNILLKKF